MALFVQNSFGAGLDTELNPTKIPRDAYPLLINGRARQNVIAPTHKHQVLDTIEGNYQGLYAAGNILVLFVSGVAYYADLTQSPINFVPIIQWTPMDVAVPRLYAEIVPATSNFFNYTGTPDTTSRTFNGSIAAFKEALFVFDGTDVNRPQAIFPDGTVKILQDFLQWTRDNPEYVPFGLLPCFTANKLFLASIDKKRLLHSVSGRASDFMVNRTNAGAAGGDANTVSATVSLNDITAIKPLASGQVFVSTLYGTWIVDLDYDNTIFGEPYLNPIPAFPAGALNDLSTISIAAQTDDGFLADTAFITQSGVHAFNAVAQAQRESNNFPLGKKIKGLLLNPQADTCAITFDDYAFFALNTIYGYGALVYDTTRRIWISLDLSFGHVKQFAATRVNGQERLFFITHENKVYEAFASDEVNSTRVYLGEFVPQSADQQALINMVDTVFLNVRNSGQAKITLFADGAKHDESVQEVAMPGYTPAPPDPIPTLNVVKTTDVGWQPGNKALCWNAAAMIEWNFNGELSEISLDGEIQQAENVSLAKPTFVDNESFAFFGETGSTDINEGTDFADGFICVPVTKGHTYVYFANGNGRLVSGRIIISDKGIFVANQDRVAIEGPGIPTWSLRDITEFTNVLDAARSLILIGGGNHSYHFGTALDVSINSYPLRNRIFDPIAGPVDIGADLGKYFYNYHGIPRYYTKAYQFVEFFFYNYDPNEPDGINAGSKQASWLRAKLAASIKPFKLVVIATPPYTTEEDQSPGNVAMRLPWITWGAHAVLSGVGAVMERQVVDGLPYFTCGTGGANNQLGSFAGGTEDIPSFRRNDKFGYLHIQSDPLTCLFTFRDTHNNTLDEYAIYS